MRILYVTGAFPYPLTSGYLRHYFFIRELAHRKHEITLLAVAGSRFEPAHAAELERYAERVLPFSAGARGRTRLARVMRQAGSPVNGPAGTAEVRLMRSCVQRLLAEQRFDAALLAGRAAFGAVEAVGDIPLVADICDASSMRLKKALHYEPPERLLLSALDYVKVRRIEREMVQRADRLMFASVRDRDTLVGANEPRASVVANGVDLDFWQRSTPTLGRDTIIMTGVMSYPPNTDAALQLIHKVLPLVRRSVPDAKLLLVGRNPSWRLKRAARGPGIELTGYVADIRPYLEQATVFAAPLRFGAGIQNKVLEAMAMEIPTVVSPLVAEGISSPNGAPPPFHVASHPEQFADLICRELAQRRENSLAVQGDARRFVANHFQWGRSGDAIEEILTSAVSRMPRGRKACSPSR
jgi:polysaccharide biosynthesis protein PslH